MELDKNNIKESYNFKMESVFNFNTGLSEDASFFLSGSEETIYKLRYALQSGKKSYGCPVCKTKVILKRSKLGNFFFAHLPIKDGVKCFLVNQNKKKRTIQEYNYRKESEEHIYLKKCIAKLLETSPGVNHSTIKIEKRVTDVISSEWKQPDIQCLTNNGRKLAIEIQLCRTWLVDIVKRDLFYQKLGISILWVFNEFDIDNLTNHSTQKDIFYNNPNLNVFVFDNEVEEISKNNNQIFLKCCYQKVIRKEYEVHRKWTYKIIKLNELKFDKETKKPFYNNTMAIFEKERAKAKAEWREHIKRLRNARAATNKKNKKLLSKKNQKKVDHQYLKPTYIYHIPTQSTVMVKRIKENQSGKWYLSNEGKWFYENDCSLL